MLSLVKKKKGRRVFSLDNRELEVAVLIYALVLPFVVLYYNFSLIALI